jgi:hypothetical protein
VLRDRWWDRDDNPEPDVAVWRIVDQLWKAEGSERAQDADDYLSFYFGNQRYGIGGYRSGFAGAGLEAPGYNVIQACTDTKVAHIVKNRVRPFFLTEKGDRETQEKAQGMTKAVEGIFRDVGLYGTTALDLCFHGSLFDGGVLKWTPDYANNRVLGECVDPWKILIPEREAQTRNPRQYFYRDRIDRAVMLDMFRDAPEHVRQAIEDAPPAPYDIMLDAVESGDGEVSDLIEFAEAWHLPSGRVDRKKRKAFGLNDDGEIDDTVDPGHDGVRTIVIRGTTCLREPWPYAYPPLVFFLPLKRPTNFWSRGIPETLLGSQMALNRMNARVDGIMNLHARPLLYLWAQAKVNPGKITNDYANILIGQQPAGQALQYITPQSVPAEYLARIEKIIAWAKEQAGIPDTSITANRPAGIEHAPALQFLADVESIRNTPAFQAWEEVFVQSARRIVDILRLLAERNKNFEVIWGDSKEMKKIKWKQVDLDDDKWTITVWPTNLLPQTPAAKVARVIELLKNQIIDQKRATALLDFPDIAAALGDSNAALRNIEEKLQAAIDGDEVRAMAHPYLSLELAFQLGKDRLNALEADGADADTLDRVRQFVEDCDELIQRAAAAAAPPMMPPPDGGGGVPVAPPLPAGAPAAPPAALPAEAA